MHYIIESNYNFSSQREEFKDDYSKMIETVGLEIVKKIMNENEII